MTPEQNKHTEQAAQKFYETEYNNLPGRSGNRIIGTFIAGAEYAFSHLSPGGWVRGIAREPAKAKQLGLRWKNKSGRYIYGTGRYYGHGRFGEDHKGSLYIKEDQVEWYDETLSPSDKEQKYPIGGYAPGNYQCKCRTCGEPFTGDKRAVQCETCASGLPKDDKDKQISDLKELLRFAGCPELIIDNPTWIKGKKPTDEDMQWAKQEMKKHLTYEELHKQELEAKDKEIATMKYTLLKKSAKWYSDYVKSKDKEIERLRAALIQSVEVIRQWHGYDPLNIWDTYYADSPEMKPIREALNTKEVNGDD